MEFEKRLRSEKGNVDAGLGFLGVIVSLGLLSITISVIGVGRKIDSFTNELKQDRNISQKNIPNSNVTQVTQADLTPFIVNPQ